MRYDTQEKFTHNGNDIEVRSWIENGEIFIRAFNKSLDEWADGYTHTVKVQDVADSEALNCHIQLVPELVEICKSNVLNDTWNKLSKAIAETRAENQ